MLNLLVDISGLVTVGNHLILAVAAVGNNLIIVSELVRKLSFNRSKCLESELNVVQFIIKSKLLIFTG